MKLKVHGASGSVNAEAAEQPKHGTVIHRKTKKKHKKNNPSMAVDRAVPSMRYS